MRADGGADRGAENLELGVEGAQRACQLVAVLERVGVSHGGHAAMRLELAVPLEVVAHLAHALAPAARNAADAERAVEVEVQERLHVERVADDGHALG